MEKRAERFYLTAAAQTQDAHTRKLLGDLAAAEAGHHRHATDLEEQVRQEGEEEGRNRKPSIHPDLGATWVGGTDGWVGFDPCTNFCNGLCNPRYVDHISCWTCGLGRGGDFDGLYRSGQ